MSKGFSVGDAIKFGWRVFKEHAGFLIFTVVFAYIIENFPHLLIPYTEYAIGAVLLSIIAFFLYLLMTMGLINISLKLVDGQKATIGDLFSPFPNLFKYFISFILYSLILLAGLLLLVFPMFYWGAKYGLFGFFIVDKGAGPIEALKMSAEATKGAKWDMLSLMFVSGIIYLLGLICLLVGLIVAIPVIYLAYAFVYRKLSSIWQSQPNQQPIAT